MAVLCTSKEHKPVDDFFFAYQSLSDNEQEIACFWDTGENREYATLLGFKILPTLKDLEDHIEETSVNTFLSLSEAHRHRGAYHDDPTVLTAFTIHPLGFRFAPLDAADFEEWLDSVEQGDLLDELLSSVFWDVS